MLNFTYYNPTRLIFGSGQYRQLSQLLAPYHSILILLDPEVERFHQLQQQLNELLVSKRLTYFMEIKANSEISEISQATQLARTINADFILAIGGGSTIDAAKFISCAVYYPNEDLWPLMLASGHALVKKKVALGSLLTYPSAGSEMNPYFVASNKQLRRKIACYAPMVHPLFTILDPYWASSLKAEQLALGIADSFIHILEQFITSNHQALVQDYQAATLLKTLIRMAPAALANPTEEQLGTIMLASTLALNGLIEAGVTSDWTTHWLSHELTALYQLKHAEAVLVVLPAVWRYCQADKHQQLLKYAQLVWNVDKELTEEQQVELALAKTWEFFRKLGLKLNLAEYGISSLSKLTIIKNVFDFSNGNNLGELQNLNQNKILQILELLELQTL